VPRSGCADRFGHSRARRFRQERSSSGHASRPRHRGRRSKARRSRCCQRHRAELVDVLASRCPRRRLVAGLEPRTDLARDVRPRCQEGRGSPRVRRGTRVGEHGRWGPRHLVGSRRLDAVGDGFARSAASLGCVLLFARAVRVPADATDVPAAFLLGPSFSACVVAISTWFLKDPAVEDAASFTGVAVAAAALSIQLVERARQPIAAERLRIAEALSAPDARPSTGGRDRGSPSRASPAASPARTPRVLPAARA